MNIVYGGSFNPPTKAHKLIIEKLFLVFKPDNIIVVPVGDNYGKKDLLAYEHRLEMAKLLDDRIIVSDLENNDKYLGTYNLLNKLKEYYDDLYYVIGSDNLINLDKWIDYKKLLNDFKFVVFNRYNLDLQDIIMEKYKEYKDHFLVIQIDYDISSSKFRETLDKSLIPDDVYDYIVKNELYGVKKMKNGFLKLANVTPKVFLGDVFSNLEEIKKAVKKADADIITFPELALTGYSLGDLFYSTDIINEVEDAIRDFLKTNKFNGIVIMGAPVKIDNALYNCAIVIQKDIILGIVPKSFLPNGGEFREKRWFKTDYDFDSIVYADLETPFGMIKFIDEFNKVKFGVEICYDMFAPISVSSIYSINGCNLIFNIAASDEVFGKAKTRENFILAKSKECCSIYSYTSTGLTDSTSSCIFGGCRVVASNGKLINSAELYKMDTDIMYSIVDIDKINYARDKFVALNDSIGFVEVDMQNVFFTLSEKEYLPEIDNLPYVPKENTKEAFKTISSIMELGLARRIEVTNSKTVVIGISGGLDSTLALLSAYQAFKRLKKDVKDIIAITMPGLGTSTRTKTNADILMETLGVTRREISIENSVLSHFKDIDHDKDNLNITYENAQARIRTLILMDVANDNNGIVLGTGDMSEIALGWATYNGDQMSMYNVNANIPKTLVRFMVKEYADNIFKNCKDTLYDIIATPISPELKKDQKTEDSVGKYEINDFILYNYLENGYSVEKINYLLSKAFDIDGMEYIKKFFNRFYTQQFKREASPDGVRVFDNALDPRSGFVMASDVLRRFK